MLDSYCHREDAPWDINTFEPILMVYTTPLFFAGVISVALSYLYLTQRSGAALVGLPVLAILYLSCVSGSTYVERIFFNGFGCGRYVGLSG